MSKKYYIMRLPIDGKEGFTRKQNVIANMIKNVMKKPNAKPPPMTEVLRFYSQKPVYIYEDEVANFFIKSKRKQRTGSIFI